MNKISRLVALFKKNHTTIFWFDIFLLQVVFANLNSIIYELC